MEEGCGNFIKYSLLNKSLQPPFNAFYDFNTIIETEDQTKLCKLIKNKDKSFTVKNREDKSKGFALVVYCLEGIEHENEMLLKCCKRNIYIDIIWRPHIKISRSI